MDRPAALRPLLEAEDAVRRLDEYENAEELGAAIRTVVSAMERSLRIRLRNDPDAPDDHRLSALSEGGLPLEDVLQSLRARDRIAIETAGGIHVAKAADRRAEEGTPRPSDADVVRDAVQRLRADLEGDAAVSDAPIARPVPDADEPAPDGTDRTDATGLPGPDAVVGADGRWMAWIAIAFAALFVIGAGWVVLRGGNEEWDEAVAAFRAGRVDSAAAGFERLLEDRGRDVTVMLYLGRSYRRLARFEDAAEVLRQAVEVDGEDADVRRELGHLFMDLDRPVSAISQYERALEYDPDDPLNWAALIAALRATDPDRAEQLLRDAPDEVRAALGVDAGP